MVGDYINKEKCDKLSNKQVQLINKNLFFALGQFVDGVGGGEG
tara:strand:+ start:162 stop:290 length:129 start_codon:yes stop_codon:yes gene_type:complete